METEAKIRQRIREHAEAVGRLDDSHRADIAAAAQLLIDCLSGGGRVYVCGNGGSAADAQHIAGELVGRFLIERRALPCISLSSDTSNLTCIGNDYDFASVFSRQVEALVRPGDVLWGLSTSGGSANVVAAAKAARRQGGKVLSFTGGDGGELKPLSDVCFVAPAGGSFAVQQIHQIAYHVICELVEAGAQAPDEAGS